MAITIQTYERFLKLTKYPANLFVVDVKDFFRDDFPKILNFYSGKTKFIDKKHIKNLNRLAEESIKITGIFRDYKQIMNTVDFWELLDSIEDLKSKLKYVQNISKYLRSSLIKGKVEAGYVYDYDMIENETLEDISRNVQDNTGFSNDWVNIAIENDLREVDWDIDGGTELELRDNSFQAGLVTSMIDNTIGDRIYGKDIKKLLTFEDDDLLVLGYKDTVYQTVNTLSTLSKNDIPESPYLGLNTSIWKGTTISKINFPLISRELKSVFDSDDLFKDFKVKSIDYKDGDIFIEYEIGTKRDLVIINNVTI